MTTTLWRAGQGADRTQVSVTELGDGHWRITLPGAEALEVEAFVSDGHLVVRDGARTRRIPLEKTADGWRLRRDGLPAVDVAVTDERRWQMQQVLGGGAERTRPELVSPMAGKVVLVQVKAGDAVVTGQTLVVIEAMKMENELRATAPAVIREVRFQAGELVRPGDVLLAFETDPV
jgi:biotin carboxyl carrier protein